MSHNELVTVRDELSAWNLDQEDETRIRAQLQSRDPNPDPVRIIPGHFFMKLTVPEEIAWANRQAEMDKIPNGRLRTCVSEFFLHGSWWRHLCGKEGKELEVAFLEREAEEKEAAEHHARGCVCLPRSEGHWFCRCGAMD